LAGLVTATAIAVPVAPPASATFPAKNGLLAFQAVTADGNQIFTVRPNGKDMRQVTDGPGEATTPDWSPDGAWLAYSLDECTVALVRPDGRDQRTIPSQHPEGCETAPAFTPDGRHLVFEVYDAVNNDNAVWIMGIDGSGRRRIGTGPYGTAATPAVSPDGQTVSFLSLPPDERGEIWAMDLAGGVAHQVSPTLNGITFKHDWAPDGSRLVMSDNADQADRPVNVVTIRPDGTGLRYLTDFRRPDERALAGGYSPDGKWISYRLEKGSRNALMVMRTDGRGSRTVLPFSSFRPRNIDWGPGGR